MSTGLQVFNPDGDMLIDTSFPNYGFIGKYLLRSLPKGRPVGMSGTLPGTWYYLDITGRFAPILFFGNGRGAGINTVEVSGSSFRFFFEYGGDATDTTQVYVFDLMSSVYPNGAVNGVGMESFTPTGDLIFTTAMKPLKLVHNSIVGSTLYSLSEGAFAAYGGIEGNVGGKNGGTNGHSTGGGWADTWVVDNVPQGITIAAGMSRFRYGASGSSTEHSYGDALFEAIIVKSLNGINSVTAGPLHTGISGEGWGGVLGTQLDSIGTMCPQILIIDVSNY